MNKIFSTLRKIQIKQIFTACVLGMLLFVTQACSSVDAKAPDSTYEGGMNTYSDVDPRSKDVEAAAKIKAKGLKDNAEVNVLDQSDSLIGNTRRSLDKKAENLDTSDAVDSLTNKVGDVAEDAKLSTQRAARDAKLSTKRAAEDASNAVERTLRDAIN